MEDQRGIITTDIISLIISMIITEEHGKTIDIIFIDPKQYDGMKDISSPPVTEGNFVDLLNTDELFCDYFNAFLRLPSFVEPLVYNRKTGLFEVLTDAPKELARKIKRYVIAEHRNRSRPLFDSLGRKSDSNRHEKKKSSEDQPPFDICFAVETLDRVSGMDWIRRNRLPLFLESEVCMEYRLAVLMAQVEEVVEDESDLVTMKIDYSAKSKEIEQKKLKEVVPAETVPMEAIIKKAEDIVTDTLKFALNIVSLLDKHPEDAQNDIRDDEEDEEEDGFSSSDSVTGEDELSSMEEQEIDYEKEREEHDEEEEEDEEEEVLREEIAIGYLEVRSFEIEGRRGEVSVQQFKDIVSEMQKPRDKKVLFAGFEDKEAESVERFEVKDSESVESFGEDEKLDFERETKLSRLQEKQKEKEERNKEEPRTKREPDAKILSKSPEAKISSTGPETTTCSDDRDQDHLEVKEDSEECHCVMRDMSRDDLYDDNISVADDGSLHTLEPKSYALKSLKGVEQFKTSLSGLPGEKRWNLWMDIEKAKLIKDPKLVDRHIACMKDRYVRNGGAFELALETREELGLQDPTNWHLEKLLSIQDQLIEPLLLYWVPAFLIQRKLESRVKTFCALDELRRLDPPPESYPHQRTLPPLPFRPSDCQSGGLPHTPEKTSSSSDRSEAPETSSTALLHEPSIPEDDILLMPLATRRRKYTLPERRWSVQVSRRRHWRELLEEQEAGWYDKRSPPSVVWKPSNLRRLPSVGEMNENAIRKEVALGKRTVPMILAAAHKTNQTVLEMDSSSAEFCGGERMEGLLQALDSDNEAGAYFLKELDKYENQLWLNALMFWKVLQAYHEEILRSPSDFTLIEKKAKQMFSEFVSSSAPFSIQATKTVRENIFNGLSRPTDELFDDAEKYTLMLLYAAWTHVIEHDLQTYDAIKKVYMHQTLDQDSKYVKYVQKRGLIRKKLQEPVIRSRRKVVYAKTSRERLPSDLRSITLDDVKRRMSKLSGFKKFLAENFASLDLQCLQDIEQYRRIPRPEVAKVVAKAMDIKWKYYNEKYLFGPNSPANKEGQNKIVELTGGMKVVEDPQGVLEEASIYELEKYVRIRLEEKWVPLYLTELAKKGAKKKEARKVATHVARAAKKGSKKGLKDSSRPSVSDEDDKVGSLKSKQDKKRGKGKRKKAERMGYKEETYRRGAGVEGPGSRGANTLSSWEHTFYNWAFDREKVLNLFPGSKLQSTISGLPPDYETK